MAESSRVYPLPPGTAPTGDERRLVHHMAGGFAAAGFDEPTTGDLTELAARVREFLHGHRPQVDDRLHTDPAVGQCPRCWARHNDPGSPVRAVDGGFECVRCDRMFGIHAGTADGIGG